MRFGIVKKERAVIYEIPARKKVDSRGTLLSAVADEMLCGMGVLITGEKEQGFLPVKIFYGYYGYAEEMDLQPAGFEEIMEWEQSKLKEVSVFCADVMNLPRADGVPVIHLWAGSLVKVLEEEAALGWSLVQLADGRQGYVRNHFLKEKKYSQAGLWKSSLPQRSFVDAEEFREDVRKTALSYLGVQYRWGGKSPAGIDCSGLTSVSYMRNGILIYRDAKIKEGYPVKAIPREKVRPGDLLYFPGHVALYLGNGKYVHATGKVGSGGVVINSLNPLDDDYREDLDKSMYTAGSIFCS